MNAAADACTIWLTGLPGSGKTTIATLLARELRRGGRKVEVLDGDAVRSELSPDLGFSREARNQNVRRIAYVAGLLNRNGVNVIVAAVSPYRDGRAEARRRIQELECGFVEVFASCALEELIRRDVKGLYRKALEGQIMNFTGISDPYEEPLAPDVVFHSDRETEQASLARVVAHLETLGYLTPAGLA